MGVSNYREEWGKKMSMRELQNDDSIMNNPGVYIYCKTINGPPRYVGRSDNDLKTRIRHGENKY